MTDQPKAPVVVSANAGTLDLIAAAARLLVVIFGGSVLMSKLIGAHNFLGVVDYLQSQDGIAWITAVSTFLSIVAALYKSHKRGSQIASLAADERVPDDVARVK